MGGEPKQFLAWPGKLLPRQKVVGDGAIQIGLVTGSAQVHIDKGTHYHITVIQRFVHGPANEPQARNPSPSEHSAVLRRIGQLRDRVAVLDFMAREFGTRMVIHLRSEQLFRLNRYLDVVLRDARNVKTQRRRREDKAFNFNEQRSKP